MALVLSNRLFKYKVLQFWSISIDRELTNFVSGYPPVVRAPRIQQTVHIMRLKEEHLRSTKTDLKKDLKLFKEHIPLLLRSLYKHSVDTWTGRTRRGHYQISQPWTGGRTTQSKLSLLPKYIKCTILQFTSTNSHLCQVTSFIDSLSFLIFIGQAHRASFPSCWCKRRTNFLSNFLSKDFWSLVSSASTISCV